MPNDSAQLDLLRSCQSTPATERGSPMANALTQFTVTDVAPGYWRVTFSNPPVNLEDPDTILELQELVGRMETDDELRVVVLESADPDFFINHYDVSRAAETPVAPGPTGLPTWIDTATRLATDIRRDHRQDPRSQQRWRQRGGPRL